MGILSIASYLRQMNHEVQVVDLAGVPVECWYIPESDFYGITATTPQYPSALTIIEKLKKRRGKVVVGGYHATACTARTLRESGADYVVTGEGEVAMAKIIYGHAAGVVHGELANVNALPMPAWDMLDIHDYAKLGTNSFLGPTPNMKEGYVQTGRGCPYSCSFCGQEKITERLTRLLDTDRVISYMRWWHEVVGADRFYLFDDTFTIKKDRVRALCQAIIDEFGGRIDWHCLSTTKDISEQLLYTMRVAGCKGVTFGVESLSDRVLSRVEKFMTAERNMRAITMAVNAGLKVRCQMIVGLPGESWESVHETATRLRDLPDGVVVGVHTLVPLPGSRIWEDLAASGFSSINPETVDFSRFTTIGRPGEDQTPLHDNALEVIEWREFLLESVRDKNIATYAQRRLHTS